MKKRKNRWYDKYERLAICLERFKGMPHASRDRLIAGVFDILRQTNPDILEKQFIKFPLEILRRRWYDKDPYLWLLFNGLKFVDTEVLEMVTSYLELKAGHRAAGK